jgi:fatty acid desaturase
MPTLLMILLCYGLWFVLGFYLYPAFPVIALMIFPIVIALHSSIQHEILHGHPTRNAVVNEALGFLPLAIFYPYRRYRALHLKHHADPHLTDPLNDPESYYRTQHRWEALPSALKMLLHWNNTVIGRILIGPAVSVASFLAADLQRIRSSRQIRKAWLLHLAGLAGLVCFLRLFGIPFWLYALTSAYAGLSIIAVRSFCEHQWAESVEARTIIVEKTLLSWIFLNNNLHLVHHKHPGAPWYDLPGLYAERREAWQAMNNFYVFRSYFDIFRSFALRPKEPVIHPALPVRTAR